jgi:hypothetical protein
MINKFSVPSGLVVLACACCVVLAALMVRPGAEDCPRSSVKSVAALFAPFQAFDTAMSRAATPVKELSPPEEILAEERQTIAREHATVGAAK